MFTKRINENVGGEKSYTNRVIGRTKAGFLGVLPHRHNRHNRKIAGEVVAVIGQKILFFREDPREIYFSFLTKIFGGMLPKTKVVTSHSHIL